jgi:hypothetical protein
MRPGSDREVAARGFHGALPEQRPAGLEHEVVIVPVPQHEHALEAAHGALDLSEPEQRLAEPH